MATEAELRKIFEDAGMYQPFECKQCSDNDFFISGPHSHICRQCGRPAIYGFYTTPLCQKCKEKSDDR